MKLNGSEILMECLLEQGVDTIFGYPGGAVLNIYDALYKYRDKITHYLTSHEQGAAHAADGYARATGKVGVCLATSGPGATNIVTGIATAYMDSIPMVAITGNVGKLLLGKDSFQEVDIAGITMPISKHNFIVKDITNLADVVRRAFYIAKQGRPGPVLIDITKNVTGVNNPASGDAPILCQYERKPPIPIERSTGYIRKKDLEQARELIEEAKKPFIYIGGGVIAAEASELLTNFVKRVDAPVCSSLMGLGAFPASHEYHTGMIGMHGTKAANSAATECDLLIAIGARFSDRVVSKLDRFAPNAKVLHIDVDPAEVNKNVRSYASIIGDAAEVLERLLGMVGTHSNAEWVNRVLEWKRDFPPSYKNDGTLKPQYILERISALTQGDAIITTEVGQHQMWSCHYIKHEKPRHFLSSGGLGTMGYGLGASIGAKVGMPDKLVFNIAGDGCFRMNNIELATAVEYGIPVIVVILNNRVLGMVRQWQSLFYERRYSHTNIDRATDFVALARAYKAEAFTISATDEVDGALLKAIELSKQGKPVVINCEIDKDEKIFPMVAPGAGIDEMIFE
jgi:acetolactate synthase-1/2/3 large subunit